MNNLVTLLLILLYALCVSYTPPPDTLRLSSSVYMLDKKEPEPGDQDQTPTWIMRNDTILVYGETMDSIPFSLNLLDKDGKVIMFMVTALCKSEDPAYFGPINKGISFLSIFDLSTGQEYFYKLLKI